MSTYEYRAIHHLQHAFRLVLLRCGKGADIRCELVHASFDEDALIPYEALSYTWGSTQDPQLITIDGHSKAVTRNLYQALYHLRYQRQDRVLWIDAICIDQDNNAEKSHQVQQMHSIYKNAEQVIVWLGMLDANATILMGTLAIFEEATRHIKVTARNMETLKAKWEILVRERQQQVLTYTDNLSSCHVLGIRFILAKSWFRRGWIIQEIFSARRATVHCGTFCISSKTLAFAPDLLNQRVYHIGEHCRTVLDLLAGPANRPEWWSETLDLFTLVYRFRGAETTIARDRIYALLRIWQSLRGCGGADEDRYAIWADYEVAEAVVVKRAMRAIFYGLPESAEKILPETLDVLFRDLHRIGTTILALQLRSGDTDSIDPLLRTLNGHIDLSFDMIEHAEHNQRPFETCMLLVRHCNNISLRTRIMFYLVHDLRYKRQCMDFMSSIPMQDRPAFEGAYDALAISHDVEVVEHFLQLEFSGSNMPSYSTLADVARNRTHGDKLMNVLLKRLPKTAQISSSILSAAASNEDLGPNLIVMLLQHGNADFQITGEVLNHAFLNKAKGQQILFDLLQSGRPLGIIDEAFEEIVHIAARQQTLGLQMVRTILSAIPSHLEKRHDLSMAALEAVAYHPTLHYKVVREVLAMAPKSLRWYDLHTTSEHSEHLSDKLRQLLSERMATFEKEGGPDGNEHDDDLLEALSLPENFEFLKDLARDKRMFLREFPLVHWWDMDEMDAIS